RLRARDVARLDHDLMAVRGLPDAGAEPPEHVARRTHVGELRDVAKDVALGREQRREQERQRRVLGAAHQHLALEGVAPLDPYRAPVPPPPFWLRPRGAAMTRSTPTRSAARVASS